MITAVDTNVLLDVLLGVDPLRTDSLGKLNASFELGSLIISELVYAELAANFAVSSDLDRFIQSTGLELKVSQTGVLQQAGTAWRAYTRRRPQSAVCPRCGNAQVVICQRCTAEIRPRQHMLADFIIGAHALTYADRLLTRDRGSYATYFPELTLA